MTIIKGTIIPKRWFIVGIKKQGHGSYKSLYLSSLTAPEHFSQAFLWSTAWEFIYVLCIYFRSLTWLPVAPLPLLAAITECLFALRQSEVHFCFLNQRLWNTLLLIKWTNDLHNICLWGENTYIQIAWRQIGFLKVHKYAQGIAQMVECWSTMRVRPHPQHCRNCAGDTWATPLIPIFQRWKQEGGSGVQDHPDTWPVLTQPVWVVMRSCCQTTKILKC